MLISTVKMPELVKVYLGNVIHCTGKFTVNCQENGFVAVRGKQIISIGQDRDGLVRLAARYQIERVQLSESQILVPGFVDAHIHAPQYPNAGLGYHRTLLDWLSEYTFKLERQYRNLEFARDVFDRVVRKTLDHGTTTACYFGSLYSDASLVLVDSVLRYGQRALVGKVNMTESSDQDYVEDAATSLRSTAEFVAGVAARQSDLVQAIITPRFALSTDIPHMTDLGELARKHDLCIQTHISENKEEVRIVEQTYGMSYANVYDQSGILTPKTVLAHGIHLTDDELQIIAARGASVAHCPASNTCLKSGICDLRRLLRHNIKVGLGSGRLVPCCQNVAPPTSDISGGPTASIRETMKLALDASTHLSFSDDSYQPLNYQEVFYLATLGGAEVLALDRKIGNFEVGKEFDALIIDMDVPRGPTDYFAHLPPMELLQKFIYCGDDRNVVQVFVAGVQVKHHSA